MTSCVLTLLAIYVIGGWIINLLAGKKIIP